MGPQRGHLLTGGHHCACLIGALLLAGGWALAGEQPATSKDSSRQDKNNVIAQLQAKQPLVYTRLRHDKHSLEVERRFKLDKPHTERQQSLQLSGPHGSKQLHSYYESPLHSALNVTEEELMIEALDRTYLTRLIPAYLYDFDTPGDAERAADPRLVSTEACRRDLAILSELLRLQSVAHEARFNLSTQAEALALFDSYAATEPGVLWGNYHWVGNWRQCNHRHIFQPNLTSEQGAVSIEGRYCIAVLKSPNWAHRIQQKSDRLVHSGYFKRPRTEPQQYRRFFRLQTGVCLPRTCDSLSGSRPEEAETSLLLQRLVTHKLSEPYASYQLSHLFCLPDDGSPLRRLSWPARALLALGAFWVLIVLVATRADFVEPQRRPKRGSTGAKLVSALSLRRNLARLLETKSLQARAPVAGGPSKPMANDLLFLNSLKVISMPIIIFGHAGMLGKQLDKFPLDYDALDNQLLFHFHASAVFLVDWYFVITGFLTTYLMFVGNKIERNSCLQWAYTMFHRYWRLAPLYIMLFAFSRHLFEHTSSGPNWDYGTSNMTVRGICKQESWITPLTLTANMQALHEECIMPAWYISADMQFYMLTPLLLIALAKCALLGWLLCLGLISGCLSLRLHRYLYDPRVQPLELMRPRYDLYMRNNYDLADTYVKPHYRIATYLVGVLAGHYTYMVLSGQWRSVIHERWVGQSPSASSSPNPNLNLGEPSKLAESANDQLMGPQRRISKLGVFLRHYLFAMGCCMVGCMSFATGIILELFPRALEPQVRYFTALVYTYDHLVAGLGLALILVTLALGELPCLRRALSHPWWTLVSRLNYFVFLVQVELIYWLLGSREQTHVVSTGSTVRLWLELLSLCYLLSSQVTLWLEMPLANLEREFIGSRLAAAAPAAAAAAAHRKPAASPTGPHSGPGPAELEARLMGSAEAACSINAR